MSKMCADIFRTYRTVHRYEAQCDFLGLPVYWTIGHSTDKNVSVFGYELCDEYQGSIYDGSDEDIDRTDISVSFHGRQNDVLGLCMYWRMPSKFCI